MYTFFVMVFYPYLGNGPVWNMSEFVTMGNCHSTWWTNILFIGNFWPQSDFCNGLLWYVFNDFQFFLMLPFVAILYNI